MAVVPEADAIPCGTRAESMRVTAAAGACVPAGCWGAAGVVSVAGVAVGAAACSLAGVADGVVGVLVPASADGDCDVGAASAGVVGAGVDAAGFGAGPRMTITPIAATRARRALVIRNFFKAKTTVEFVDAIGWPTAGGQRARGGAKRSGIAVDAPESPRRRAQTGSRRSIGPLCGRFAQQTAAARFHGREVPRPRCSTATRFHGYEVPRLRGSTTAVFHGYEVPRLRGSTATRFYGYEVPRSVPYPPLILADHMPFSRRSASQSPRGAPAAA
jgi:hypothetical protein